MKYIYFGGVRGIIKKYLKEKDIVAWVVRSEDFEQTDKEFSIEPYVLNSHLETKILSIFEDFQPNDIKCVSFHDNYHDLARNVALHFGWKCNIINSCNEITKNKYKSREAANSIFDLSPRSFLIANKDDLTVSRLRDFTFPLIVKPNSGTASNGVKKINDFLELQSLEEYENNLVEEFIDGQEFSVETVSHKGKHKVIMIAKKKLFPNSFVEKSHGIGLSEADELWGDVERKVSAFLDKVGYQTGISHTEIKIVEGKIGFIECQLRMGGDYLWYAFEALTGQNLSKIAYYVEENVDFDLKKVKTTRHMCDEVSIEYLHWYSKSFKFLYWEGVETARLIPGVILAETLGNNFHCSTELKSSSDRDFVLIAKTEKNNSEAVISKASNVIQPIFTVMDEGTEL